MTTKLKILDKNENIIKIVNLEEKDLITRSGREKSILDIMLDNDIDMFYGCMGGSCGACICDLENGGEFVEKEKIRPKVYKNVSEKEILTCIAGLKTPFKDNSEIVVKKKF